jgi:pimeloyl-ACP methyl ester carboxylesterase
MDALLALALAVAGAVLALLLVATALAFRITHPKRRRPGAEIALLEGLRHRRVEFPSTDGKRLVGLFLEGRPGDAAIVVCHGIGAYKENLLGVGRLLNLQGFPVLLFDFRGHGESEADSVSIGPKEARDVLGAFEFLRSEGYRRFGLFGLSMGAAAAAYAAPQVPELAAVVLDSCPASLERIMRHLRRRSPILVGLVGRLTLASWRLFTGFPAKAVRPVDEIEKIPVPLLLIHGDADRLIDPKDLDLLFERARSPKEKLVVPGAAHGETFRKGNERYQDAVRRLFRSRLAP